MSKNYYISGEWNLTCDICSKKIKAHESKQRWDGFLTCHSCWEPRHEQDFVRARQDKITIPFQRPIPELVFTNVVYICTVEGRTAIANMAVAGCSITGTR